MSDLRHLTLVLKWVSTREMKEMIKDLVSDLCFMRYNQVHLKKLSTMVRKYCEPLKDLMEKGPQISQRINSKTWEDVEELKTNGNLC